MRYLIFTSRDSTRKRVLAFLLLLLWLCLLALWNSLVWSSGVCFVRPIVVGIGWQRISTIFLFHLLFRRSSIKRKKGLKITEDALNDSMRMKCEEIIWPADLATLQWALVRKAMDGPQNVASLIEGLHLSAEHPASENFVFERCVLNNAVPAKLYPVNATWEIFRNHSSVEEYSELGRRACMIQNAAFYPVLQRTIVETASLCCPHAGMVNFVRGMLDISKTEVTFRERRRGNLEINNIENGRLTIDYSLNALARKVE
ncbi:hypothetical protein T03_10225 [Trichinella britovi]|uniref:Uncharacterized protein n=1 Tax=Trichinella britovi TaxID=45882 RepID=A0A0V1D8H6_TRIBR|nr:hypothetical protein T03_10225 [Trichinella britovi]